MPKNFPIYDTHDAARCFNCNGETGNVLDCEYPPGLGQYRKTCGTCGYHTYYDLKRAPAPEHRARNPCQSCWTPTRGRFCQRCKQEHYQASGK
jgi:hypothetical protein